MKRIISILTLLLFLTACDDGNLTVDVIDFSEVAAQKCSSKDVIYKIKDREMLLLEIPGSTFEQNQTLVGENDYK
jgi:PBP1b-binding outer membrane lipoprotein LpoB